MGRCLQAPVFVEDAVQEDVVCGGSGVLVLLGGGGWAEW